MALLAVFGRGRFSSLLLLVHFGPQGATPPRYTPYRAQAAPGAASPRAKRATVTSCMCARRVAFSPGASEPACGPSRVVKGPHDAVSNTEENEMNLNHPRLRAEIRVWNRRLDPCGCPRCGGLPENPREVHYGAGELYPVGGDVYRYTGDRMSSVLSLDWALESWFLCSQNKFGDRAVCTDCKAVVVRGVLKPHDATSAVEHLSVGR